MTLFIFGATALAALVAALFFLRFWHDTRDRLFLLTPLIPFCVTLLGAFLHSRPAVQAKDLRPGWAVVRRSLGIALGVGSVIILLNHGDVLLAGTITPRVVVKILVTPWVPFCVS
jgi:hypothetical protein